MQEIALCLEPKEKVFYENQRFRYCYNKIRTALAHWIHQERTINKVRKETSKAYSFFSNLFKTSRRITYGKNEIDVPVVSIGKLLALEALTPFYVFQIFSIIVWVSEFYYYYCIAIVVMSVFGIASSIIQTRKVRSILRSITQFKVVFCRTKKTCKGLYIQSTRCQYADLMEYLKTFLRHTWFQEMLLRYQLMVVLCTATLCC